MEAHREEGPQAAPDVLPGRGQGVPGAQVWGPTGSKMHHGKANTLNKGDIARSMGLFLKGSHSWAFMVLHSLIYFEAALKLLS